jgi:hypothetical protein
MRSFEFWIKLLKTTVPVGSLTLQDMHSKSKAIDKTTNLKIRALCYIILP